MKKRLVSLLLTTALVMTLAPAAFALGAFPDITDTETAQNAEVLRLMGVMEGDNKGRFNPDSSLTRAQFCKMTVVLTGKRSVVSRYSNYTVFPDVRATTWAAGYVNYAANHEVGLIHGMPDGTFAPSRAITYGEAAAILTRLLGYTDKDTGGIWPDGYIALATEAGMTKGLSIGGNDAITRAQAAKLFVNALSSKNEAGETMLSKLGYKKSEQETTLYSVDLANNQLRTEAGNVDLAEPKNSTALNGLKGYVLTNADGKAVTFLPSTGATTGTAVSDAAIIVGADGSTAGFDALTGGSANYSLYRNGVPAAASELKKDDVVIYNAGVNAVLACDTRVAVYYENCAPSPADPESIKVLGGTELKVMPTARQSVAQFKPGQNMVILLAADGRVAGARESGGRTNAYAYVDAEGKVSLLYGNSMKTIAEDPSESLKMDTSKVLGLVVRISQSGSRYSSTIHLSVQRGASGNLDPVKRSLGSKLIADGVLVFSGNKLTTFESLGKTVIPSDRIAYARTNARDEVDLIVIKDSSNEFYGRAKVERDDETQKQFITVDLGLKKGKTEKMESYYGVRTGDYVSFAYNSAGNFINMTPLTKLTNVAASAWIGDSVVNYGDKTYTLAEDVLCYNRDNGSWFESFSAAKAYGGKMDLYAKDGVIRAVEVRS